MFRARTFPFLIMVALSTLVSAVPATAFETVSILAGAFTLKAEVLRPAGPGPFPVVVGLHGCGGLGNRRTQVEPRMSDWAKRLSAAGFAVVLPDSFGSRGVGEQCTVSKRPVRPGIERVADVETVRRWLLDQPWAKSDRMFLIGWSNGGSTTLWAVRPQRAFNDGKPDFRAAVAFYPGCRTPAQRGWRTRLPLLILIGDADDWTPPEPCTAMVDAARGFASNRIRGLSRRGARFRSPGSASAPA